MKLRHSVLFLVLALVFGSVAAFAAPVDQLEAPAPVVEKSEEILATSAGGCDQKALAADAKLQIALAPELSWLSVSQNQVGTCGGCGDAVCNGQTPGALCNFDGTFWYACINLFGNRCSAGRQECFCTTSGPY